MRGGGGQQKKLQKNKREVRIKEEPDIMCFQLSICCFLKKYLHYIYRPITFLMLLN